MSSSFLSSWDFGLLRLKLPKLSSFYDFFFQTSLGHKKYPTVLFIKYLGSTMEAFMS